MLNLVELESRWLRYKIKSYMPYTIILVSLCITFIILTLIFNNNDTNELQVNSKKELPLEIQAQEKKQIEDKILEPTYEREEKKVKDEEKTKEYTKLKEIKQQSDTPKTLVPSMEFIKGMKNSSQPYYEDSDDFEAQGEQEPIEEIVIQNRPEIQVENQTLENKFVEEKVVEKEISKKILIKRKNTQDDIVDVIKRFKKNNNPALSLFIAKKYYELGDYRNAYNYALITNEINRDIESSWLIFSKSLVKLGKKKLAAQTLREYTKKSHSDSARILLDEIESGKFK